MALVVPGVEVVAAVDVDLDSALDARHDSHSEEPTQRGVFWTAMTVTRVPLLGAPERRFLGLAEGFLWPPVQGAGRSRTA